MSDLEQGHGDSWDTIYEDMDTLISFIPTAISQATEVAGYAKVLYQDYDREASIKQIIGIIYPLNPNVGCLSLIVAGIQKNEIVSFYPHIANGVELELTLCEIKEFDNLIEAFVIAEDKNGVVYRFLDTLYFANKTNYKIGESYLFRLSGLARDVQIVNETTFTMNEEQTLSFLAKIGKLPSENEPNKPLVFDMSGMKAFFQTYDALPSLTEFQSPIKAIMSTQIHDIDFYEVAIELTDTLADQNKVLPLYIRQDLLENLLQQDIPIKGQFFLQGYLINEKHDSSS